MTEGTDVPAAIAEMIAEKKLRMHEDAKWKAIEQFNQQTETIDKGRSLLKAKIQEVLLGVPEWIRKYDITETCWSEGDLERVGQGYNKIDIIFMEFDIPGLADIQFHSKDNTWRSAHTRSQSWENDRKPEITFYNDCYWRTDLEYVLVEAEEAYRQFLECQKAYEAYLELEDKQIGEQRKREAESDQRVDEQLKTEKSEAEQLFEVFKDDPVAVHLLKAFLMVHQERRMFDQRVSEADETMYSLEERWSRKAADLRRQAQDAERQAEDEHRRVNDLEDDLSKVKKQIKSQAW